MAAINTYQWDNETLKRLYNAGHKENMHISQQALLKIQKKSFMRESPRIDAFMRTPISACGKTWIVTVFGPQETIMVEPYIDDLTLEFKDIAGVCAKDLKVTCPQCIEKIKEAGL